ncbi:MAG: hypothetical protein KKA60_15405 [Proteobacteria bacterium]|nr:hypothetical protein [Pseudomonadota bacterium]
MTASKKEPVKAKKTRKDTGAEKAGQEEPVKAKPAPGKRTASSRGGKKDKAPADASKARPKEEEALLPAEEETPPPEPLEEGPEPSDPAPDARRAGEDLPKKASKASRKKRRRAASKGYDLSDPEELCALVAECEDEKALKEAIFSHVKRLAAASGLDGRYRILILHEEQRLIRRPHANLLLAPAREAAGQKDILLILHSSGGQIEAAYLISRMLKRLSKNRFICAAPRRAKSAATLLCLGADEIHMGILSELGPIDPQIGGYPVTWLSNAMDVLAKIASQFPDSADMLAKFLSTSLNLKSLGYFGRVNESAATYAERLLSGKTFPRPQTVKSLADHFVNHYTDHSFVIDSEEAAALLGSMVKTDSQELALAEEVYSFLDQLDQALDALQDKTMSWVGDLTTGLTLRSRPG